MKLLELSLWQVSMPPAGISGRPSSGLKNKFRNFREARKSKLAIPQNHGQPTKTVTVKVTKSVVLTARLSRQSTPIRRLDHQSDRSDEANDKAWSLFQH
jgi:hypothetical protein